MDFEQLRQLDAIEREGTVTKAAARLHLSQPALSRSMQRLEAEIGHPLFDRTCNRVQLNEAGRITVEYARSVLQSTDALKERLDSLDRKTRTVRIGSCAPAPLWRLIPALAECTRGLIVESSLMDHERLEQGTLDGTIDVAITAKPLPFLTVLSRPFMTESLSVSLPPDHPLRRRSDLSFADLDGETFLIFDGIGFWWDVCKRNMPHARYVVQNDSVVFSQLLKSTPLPFFVTECSVDVRGNENRAKIPLSDTDAHATYYANILQARRQKPLDAAALSHAVASLQG